MILKFRWKLGRGKSHVKIRLAWCATTTEDDSQKPSQDEIGSKEKENVPWVIELRAIEQSSICWPNCHFINLRNALGKVHCWISLASLMPKPFLLWVVVYFPLTLGTLALLMINLSKKASQDSLVSMFCQLDNCCCWCSSCSIQCLITCSFGVLCACACLSSSGT